jgi:drug/metabolite transporter (DMT)-like permease
VDPIVFVLVATAAVLHVAWNVLLKTAGEPLRAAAVGMATAAAVLCPIALVAWLLSGRPTVPSSTLTLAVASGALEAVYFAFLAAAYRRGDLSLVYPLARGTAPLIAVAIGVIVLGETLSPTGSIGVVCLLIGIVALQRPWQYLREAGREHGGAAGYAMLCGVTIAAYSAVDSVGVRGTTVWIYAGLIWAWMTAFLWAYVFVYRWRASARLAASTRLTAATGAGSIELDAAGASDGPNEPARFSTRRAGIGGLFTLAAYLLILAAYSVAPLTAVAPLRESAIVLASGWGALRLREAADPRDAVRRIAAAALVVAGAVLLALE